MLLSMASRMAEPSRLTRRNTSVSPSATSSMSDPNIVRSGVPFSGCQLFETVNGFGFAILNGFVLQLFQFVRRAADVAVYVEGHEQRTAPLAVVILGTDDIGGVAQM